MFTANEKFKDPELRKFVVKERSKGNSWKNIVESVTEKFEVTMSLPTAQTIFNREIAGSTLSSPKSRDTFQAEFSDISIRLQKLLDRMEKLNQIVDDMYSQYDRNIPEEFLKHVPVLLAILRENLSQCQFIRGQQDKIMVQQKNLIYSPIQIMMKMDDHMRSLEKDGKIKVLVDRLPSEEEGGEEE